MTTKVHNIRVEIDQKKPDHQILTELLRMYLPYGCEDDIKVIYIISEPSNTSSEVTSYTTSVDP